MKSKKFKGKKSSPIKKIDRKSKITLCVCIFLMLINFAFEAIYKISEGELIPYNELVSYIQNEEVESIELSKKTEIAKITLKEGDEKSARIPNSETFSKLISDSNQDIDFKINEKESFTHEIYNAYKDSTKIVMMVIIILLLMGLLSAATKLGSDEVDLGVDDDPLFGNNKKFGKEAKSNVRFDDVAGIDEERQQLEELVCFLKDSEKYSNIGAKIPKGVLLTGAPGVGKTLLAKAIAGEAGVPFFQETGSSFDDTFVGVGSKRVRTLFKKARAKAPSIVFIDEIDTIGAKRYTNKNNSEQTLNQLLAEMDGFDSSSGVIVIAATNHPEMLDSAITRPGRFDRKIYIPMPDVYARTKILDVHSRNKKLDEGVNLESIAKKTVGFSGAELSNLLNEAAILAVNRGAETIQQQDVDEAFARVVVGLEKKNRKISDEDKYQTAIHEAGHAIASAVLQPNVENLGISIVPRGRAGGYNLATPTDERLTLTKEDAISEMVTLYAGKAAEQVVLGIVSTGPENDLQQSSEMAYSIVLKYAMCGSMLTLVGNDHFDSVLIEKRTKMAEDICEDAYKKSVQIIEANKEVLIELAKMLMEKENMSAEEFKTFMADKTLVENINNENTDLKE